MGGPSGTAFLALYPSLEFRSPVGMNILVKDTAVELERSKA